MLSLHLVVLAVEVRGVREGAHQAGGLRVLAVPVWDAAEQQAHGWRGVFC
jgi:hypothetical protein